MSILCFLPPYFESIYILLALLSHETGKPLHEAVEHVVAWASLHRVRQFQFFGIPSRQTYRELRLLAGQLQRKSNAKKGGQQLADKAMDDVLATYILKQGGVLVPRKDHTVRTAYVASDTLNAYGEKGMKIYGVWSPRLGIESRIGTHDERWQRVSKVKNDKQPNEVAVAVDLPDGFSVPWTRGNNCPLERKISIPQKVKKVAVPMRV